MLERAVSLERELTCTQCWVRTVVIVLRTVKTGEEIFAGCPRCGKTEWMNLPDVGQTDAEQLHRDRAAERDFNNRLDAQEARLAELAMRDFDEEAERYL